VLDDPAFSRYWGNIARIIGFVAKDDEAVRVLLKYATRAEEWRTLNDRQKFVVGQGKIRSLRAIGMIGTELANETLRKAITFEGAQEMIRHWSDKSEGSLPGPFGSMRSIVQDVRSSAAVGLVLTRKPDNVALVKKLYDQERVYPEDWQERGLYRRDMNVMTGAMTYQAVIDEKGWDYLVRAIDTEEELSLLGPYMKRFESHPPGTARPNR